MLTGRFARGCWVAMVLLVSDARPARAGEVRGQMAMEGRTREYRLHVPPASAPAKKRPLVLIFHGGGDSARGMERLTRFNELADREGFLALYPEAVGHQWNDGRWVKSLRSQREGVDDVAFVRALIHLMQRDYQADPSRTYATGFSNGAIFCHHLAIRLADQLAAIAAVGGGIAEPETGGRPPSSPVSVFIIHGTRDPLVPYKGGPVDHGSGGRVISINDTLRCWLQWDGCRRPPTSGLLPDLEPADHCIVRWTRWRGARNDSEILLYSILGGGHQWPGGHRFFPAFVMGWRCDDFDATEAVWSFFCTHSTLAINK